MFVSGPMEMVVGMERDTFSMQANVAFEPSHDAAGFDAIVIGGGPAGLAAAKYLADAGRTALVLEKRPVLGGKLSSWRDRDGDVLETGLHSFFGGYDTVLSFLRDVGIASHVLWQPHTLTFAMPPGFSNRVGAEPVFEEFHFIDAPSPFNGIGAVLNARYVFNAWEKVLFAAGTLPVLVGDQSYADRQDDITYADWHRRRRMSEHMLQTFFAPMALALNFTPVESISAEAMLRVMAYFASSRDASRSGFLDGPPNERLIEPIADHVRAQGVRIESNARVGELLFSGDRCSGVRTTDGRTFEAENVMLATPVHDAAKLLPAAMLRDPLVRGVGLLKSSPVINGHFWFDRPISPHSNLIFGAGTLLPVHADLGQASPGYGWRNKSFIEVCIAPADDLHGARRRGDRRARDGRHDEALSAGDQANAGESEARARSQKRVPGIAGRGEAAPRLAHAGGEPVPRRLLHQPPLSGQHRRRDAQRPGRGRPRPRAHPRANLGAFDRQDRDVVARAVGEDEVVQHPGRIVRRIDGRRARPHATAPFLRSCRASIRSARRCRAPSSGPAGSGSARLRRASFGTPEWHSVARSSTTSPPGKRNIGGGWPADAYAIVEVRGSITPANAVTKRSPVSSSTRCAASSITPGSART